MSLLDIGLSFEGMPEATIKALDAQLPAIERIMEGVKQLEPHITAGLPIVNKMWPDIVAVTPLMLQIVQFLKQKESQS